MDEMKYKKVLGGLLAAAVGDAMGAPTETRSMDQIRQHFGGWVTTFLKPGEDVFAHGFEAGSVTDDFSLAYATAWAIIDHQGVVDQQTAQEALLNWAHSPYYVMAGPTTMAAVDRILGKEVPTPAFQMATDNSKGSNGSAMKISPVGLASGGDIDKAIADAITICLPTHFNSTSLAGGCAVAAGVAAALQADASVESVVEAGLKGAKAGEQYATERGRQLANPSVYKRIKIAVALGKKYQGNLEKAMRELTDIIGSGLSAAEAVPTAFGLLVAANGDPGQAILAGVNIGSDTDTVATIVGGMAGTLYGYENPEQLDTINRVNGFDLELTARRLCEVSGDE